MKWGNLSFLAASALTMVACAQSPAPVTVTSATSATSATSTAKPATYVTLPDTYGDSADVAQAKLEGLGLTNVELASSNAKYSTVEQPKDWKVAKMNPGAGTVVKFNDPVVLEVVKVK